MSAKKKPADEPEEPSRTAGACVLVVLAGVVAAVTFRLSATVGVLALWAAGAAALWRAARRRMSDSSATPPPRGAAPESAEAARRRLKRARGALDPNGVMCILHPDPDVGAGDPEQAN